MYNVFICNIKYKYIYKYTNNIKYIYKIYEYMSEMQK